ncbi:N-formylglutamate amidohydrolase [Alisedimentitalea sp. MJ-SS2]|uniref:N-formylglutamate amidohydrolase n=1 Tax=Aliisedimentitalea sp. MJ-SS2 TaxID=3049795 RepID=UPI00290D0B61|nr:N-formylglutamate amidohydrolase [Alisedimentitalea sp. MJ-SS2]MDU8927801.1 N-formylglutamate amidohydrolase [Alisedimentitalea sp. MJ-SS2]
MTYQSYEIHEETRESRWLITCDHASNAVPPEVASGDLGLPPADMNRHIAYDLGAAGVTHALADLMGAPAILSRFSRLVIDPNRGQDDPTLIMKLYDGTIVPANRHIDHGEEQRRIAAYWKPYHDAYEALATRRDDTVIVAIHSFSPKLNGRKPRPWQIGVLHAGDTSLGPALVARLEREPDLCVGDNEPYAGHLPGDAVDQHALQKGRPNVLIELRHDVIETDEQQHAWARRLAPILTQVLAETGL